MAIKDWKNVRNNEWKKNNAIIWIKYMSSKYVYYPIKATDWNVFIGSLKSGKASFKKSFKTKQAAIAYAKSYMRIH